MITVENDKEWLRQFEGMRSKEHWIVSDLKEVEEPSRYGLVLVDCLPDHTRRQAIDKYKSRADYLVLHDWGWKYNYPNPYKEWKYVSVYTSLEPFTAVYGQWVGPGVGG
ncbi:MAG: hypothetical protein BIFFINMI_02390 [Phycisphaerae bacterium]|nr:hypothetical protein [Phycisphaerae bacterium]